MSRATARLTAAGYSQLLHQAQRRNERDGITGLLAYDGLSFLQAFEGPPDAVRACMDRIADDDRHTSIVNVSDTRIARREFGSFSMLGLLPGADEEEFVDHAKEMVAEVSSASLKALFIGFAVLGRRKVDDPFQRRRTRLFDDAKRRPGHSGALSHPTEGVG